MTTGSGVREHDRPLIAVLAYHLGGDRVSRWPDGGYGVPAPYIESLRRSGARTAIVSPGEHGRPEKILEPYDGLLLVGGGDVDPARYGAEPDAEHNYGVEADRDAFEIDLLLAAERLHDAGALHLPGHADHERRLRRLAAPAPSRHARHARARRAARGHRDLARGRRPSPTRSSRPRRNRATSRCSSHHHQGIDRVGDAAAGHRPQPRRARRGARARRRADRHPGRQPWIVGVQWHPEETASTDPAQQSLFDALDAAREAARRPSEARRDARPRPCLRASPSTTTRGPDRFDGRVGSHRRRTPHRPRRAHRSRGLHVRAGARGQADRGHPALGAAHDAARAIRRAARRARLPMDARSLGRANTSSSAATSTGSVPSTSTSASAGSDVGTASPALP